MSYKIIRTIFLSSLLCLSLASKNAYSAIPMTTDSRIKTLVYTPNEIFQLKFHYNYQSYIEFPKDEKINIIAVGDRFAWDIKKVENRLFIKPQQSGVQTNMTIMTDNHTYHFDIVSSDKSYTEVDDDLVIVAKFFYPSQTYDYMETIRIRKPLNELVEQSQQPRLPPERTKPTAQQIDKLAKEISIQSQSQANASMMPPNAAKQKAQEKLQSKVSTNAINYRYTMVGAQSEITPTQVYDDGKNTFFEFSNNVLPDIFHVNSEGLEVLAKYTVEDSKIKIPGVAKQYSLRGDRQLLCVFNENI